MIRTTTTMALCALMLAACGDEDAQPKDEENARPPLVDVADEPPGENCEHGGRRVATGLDVDGDGHLAADEITAVAYVCDGAPGLDSLIRLTPIHREGSCEAGGLRIEVGLDVDRDGELDDDEVDPARTQYLCEPDPGWTELSSLPGVQTVYSFALAANTTDGSPRLGFMFTDPDYRQTLIDESVLWEGQGPYNGPNTYVTYRLDGAGDWSAYEGRGTPQFYRYSELLVLRDDTYYTTNYAFGSNSLISVIKNGGEGTWANTAAFAGRKAHSLSFIEGDLDHVYFIAARAIGGGLNELAFERLPVDGFGLANRWERIAALESSASDVWSPKLTNAGDVLVASYILGDRASFRATNDLAGIEAAVDGEAGFDFAEIASCEAAILADAAWDGDYLYVACVDDEGALELRRAELVDLDPPLAWEQVETAIEGAIEAIDLEASATHGVSIAIRAGGRLRVYTRLDDAPSFDEPLPGHFDHVHAADAIFLSVCDFEGDRVLRTFRR